MSIRFVMYTDENGTVPAIVLREGDGAEGAVGQTIVFPLNMPGKAAVPAGTDATEADGTFTEVA